MREFTKARNKKEIQHGMWRGFSTYYPQWQSRKDSRCKRYETYKAVYAIPYLRGEKLNVTKKASRLFLVCNILIPLVIGACVYIFWDSDSYFGNFARSVLAIPNTGADSHIAQIMRNWGCDFLYTYAVLFALYASTGNISVSICYAAVCAIGLELLQLIQVDFLKCGTFDIWDILVEIIAICFAAMLIGCCNHIKEKNGEKKNGR